MAAGPPRDTRPERATPPARSVGRHLHWHLVRRRRHLIRRGSLLALLAVVGPGILAGLSDDDPAGVTTYSILGADYGYELLWVLALSTAALVIFHELAVRMGIVTGKGLLALVRERYGKTGAVLLLVLLPFMRSLASDPAVMGRHASGRAGRILTGAALGLVAAAVAGLAVLTVTG